jgi:hypothetical protein
VCADFDLCAGCEAKGEHPKHHILLKAKEPLPAGFRYIPPTGVPLRRADSKRREEIKPKAEFMKDENLADGSVCMPGEHLLKIWSMKNTGSSFWPRSTKLVYVGGEIKPVGDEEPPQVPLAAPGEVVEIMVKVEMPKAPGRYTGYYRLCYGPENVKFGKRVWIDVLVGRESDVKRGSLSLGQQIEQTAESAFSRASESVTRALSSAQKALKQVLGKGEKDKKPVKKPEQAAVEPPVEKQDSKRDLALPKSEPKLEAKSQPAESKADAKEDPKQQPKDSVQELPAVQAEPKPAQVPESKPVEPKPEEKPEQKPEKPEEKPEQKPEKPKLEAPKAKNVAVQGFKYNKELQHLYDAGFTDLDQLQGLLIDAKGNINTVINWLLPH